MDAVRITAVNSDLWTARIALCYRFFIYSSQACHFYFLSGHAFPYWTLPLNLTLNLKGASEPEDDRRAAEHEKKEKPTSILNPNDDLAYYLNDLAFSSLTVFEQTIAYLPLRPAPGFRPAHSRRSGNWLHALLPLKREKKTKQKNTTWEQPGGGAGWVGQSGFHWFGSDPEVGPSARVGSAPRNRLCAFQTPTVEVTRASLVPGTSELKAAAAAEKADLRKRSKLEAVSRMRVGARLLALLRRDKPGLWKEAETASWPDLQAKTSPECWLGRGTVYFLGSWRGFYFPLSFRICKSGSWLRGSTSPCLKGSGASWVSRRVSPQNDFSPSSFWEDASDLDE